MCICLSKWICTCIRNAIHWAYSSTQTRAPHRSTQRQKGKNMITIYWKMQGVTCIFHPLDELFFHHLNIRTAKTVALYPVRVSVRCLYIRNLFLVLHLNKPKIFHFSVASTENGLMVCITATCRQMLEKVQSMNMRRKLSFSLLEH